MLIFSQTPTYLRSAADELFEKGDPPPIAPIVDVSSTLRLDEAESIIEEGRDDDDVA